MKSEELAFAPIRQLNLDPTNASLDQEKTEVGEEQDSVSVGVLLAFLWASEQGLLNAVTLSDVQESPHLNHQCKLIVQKIRKTVASQAGSSLDPAGGGVLPRRAQCCRCRRPS